MDKRPRIHVDSFEEYRTSVLRYLGSMLSKHYGDITEASMERIKADVADINAYSNIDHLEPINEKEIVILDEKRIDIAPAEKAILLGRFFWEHAAAGEATRLGLGTKYLLNLSRFSIEEITDHMRREALDEYRKQGLSEPEMEEKAIEVNSRINESEVLKQMGVIPQQLIDLSLGDRHMIQMSFDVSRLAKKHKKDPKKVLAKQCMLVILNEATSEEIIERFARFNFFGFDPGKVHFMVQRSFNGIYLKHDCLFYDTTTEKNKRLHNHGQMMMQKAHDNSIFTVNPKNVKERRYLKAEEYEKILKRHDDMLSYNIEDLGYLTNSIDLPSLGLALELGKEGYNMVMEIVAQNPIKPQKGGAAFFDKRLGRNVMIESNQLKDIKNEEIRHLNKNFNHYTNPGISYSELRKRGLPLSFDVKTMFDQNGEPRDYIYPCPPQGDMNFLVKTAFVMRKNLKPIFSWKSPATTPSAVKACFDQDSQKGFKEYLKSLC